MAAVVAAPVRPALRSRAAAGRLALALGAAGWLVFVLGPPLAMVAETARRVASGHSDWLWLAIPTGARGALLLRSAGLAVVVAALCMVIALPAAMWLSDPRRGRLHRGRWAILALAPLPPYVHALAWNTLAATAARSAAGGPLETMAALAASLLKGASGAAWVMAMAWLPLALGICMLALALLPPDQLEAARLQRTEAAVLGRVALPLAAPLLVAGAALVFVMGLLDYSVPTLYQVRVYSLATFAEFDAHGQAGRAVLHGAPLMLLAAGAVWIAQSGLARAATAPIWRLSVDAAPAAAVRSAAWPPWLRAATLAAVALVALQVAALAAGLAIGVRSPAMVWRAIAVTADETAYSLGVAVAAGLAVLPLAVVAARLMDAGSSSARGPQPAPIKGRNSLLVPDSSHPRVTAPGWRSGWRSVFRPGLDRASGGVSRTAWLATTLPLAVPAPLVGVGLIQLWNRPGPAGWVYGSAAMPVLAAVARFAPLAALIVLAHRRRLDPLLFDAARCIPAPRRRAAAWVYLPLLAPGLAAAAAAGAALAFGELGATLLVAPPGRGTLTLRIFSYLHYGSADAVAGLCLALALAAALAGLVASAALTGWFRRLASGTA